MIAIPIVAKKISEFKKLIDKANLLPADVLEYRIDTIEEEYKLQELIEMSHKKIMITCRSQNQGGEFKGKNEERQKILQKAIELNVEFVDCEVDIIKNLKKNEHTKIIASYHNFEETPENLLEKIQELESLPADWVKFAVMANKLKDNVRVAEALKKIKKPAIAIAMGEYGEVSRILALKWGAKLIFASLEKNRESAPGQISLHDLVNVYRVKEISEKTEIFALIGDPVKQSIGHLLHNNAFTAKNIDARYIKLKVDDIKDFYEIVMPFLNIKGCSVTVPYKEEILKYVQKKSEAVENIGAANTIYQNKNEWIAENTDAVAAINSLKKILSKKNKYMAGKNVLVMGAGGAAKAIVFALSKENTNIYVVNRNIQKGEKLAEKYAAKFIKYDEIEKYNWDIVINTTTVGMAHAINETLFPKNMWNKNMLAFDIIYNPRETKFLRDANDQGADVLDGLEMFFQQAIKQFKLFTKQEPPERVFRKAAFDNVLL